MDEALRTARGKGRASALLCQGIFVFSPFLLLGVMALLLGESPFNAYPRWTDEMDYWRSLYNWNAVGFASGYSGLLEVTPAAGVMGVHGLTPLLFYGWFVKLFGLSWQSVMACNALWVSMGALVFCLLLKPKPLRALSLTVLTAAYLPVILYVFTSMTELVNYGLLMMYIAFVAGYGRRRRPWLLALAYLTAALACFYRINYFLLFFPLAWLAGGERLNLKAVLAAVSGLVLSAALYLLSSRFTAPYTQGFLYNFTHVGDVGLAAQMLLSHIKSNLVTYLTFYKVDPIQWNFRRLYLLVMGLCLIGAFIKTREGVKKPRLGLNVPYLWSFLWLFASLVIVIALYEVMDWADFRTLAPILWLIPVYLLLKGKRLIPAVTVAGSAALLFLLLTGGEPLGTYIDPNRFIPPEQNPALEAAIQHISYDPEAQDPFQNTVRTDLYATLPLMKLEAGLGIQYGWFDEGTVGRSRWILTDRLKAPLSGYEEVYVGGGAAVYRLSDGDKES